MGQKINPIGFRLINNENYLSNWYSDKFNYSNLIKEDDIIRNNINNIFKDILIIDKIEIRRKNNENNLNKYIFINIYFLYPKEKDLILFLNKNYNKFFLNKYNIDIKLINKNILNLTNFLIQNKIKYFIKDLEFNLNKEILIKNYFIEDLFKSSTLIAKHISVQLEKRISFRKIIFDLLSKIKLTKNKGIKIQISGRLNGIEIARTEWKKYGKIPLHTLNSKIDYSQENSKTIYGILGIKVWLFY